MKIVLTGASGFLGTRLRQLLRKDGYEMHVLGRRAPEGNVKFWPWDALGAPPAVEPFEGAEAVIHLAGEPVAQRWTPEVKRRIRASRVEGTRALLSSLQKAVNRPKALIGASAVGYYGSRGDEVLMEASAPGSGFLPDVCVEWENACREAEALGLRVALLRIGVVLGPDGGALEKMLPPFRMGVGGKIGNGQQWMSWIHVEDMVGLLRLALRSDVRGVLNAVSPNPVRNAEFTQVLASVLKRPAVLPVPPMALRVLYGEMAEVLTSSQRVQPAAALKARYAFHYPDLRSALRQVLER